MTLLYATETDSKRIVSVSVYNPKLAANVFGRRIRLYHVFFILMFVYQIIWVISTIGVPYQKFLEKADREGFAVMEGQTKMKAELEHALGDINDPNRITKKLGWFDWMDMDIEEAAERKRKEKEKTVLDSLPKHLRVPSKVAPAFVPSLLTGILVVLYALVLLMQHWSVGFNTWINYKEQNVDDVTIPEEMMELHLDDDDHHHDKTKKHARGGNSSNKHEHGGSSSMLITNIPSNLPTHARIVPAKGRHVLVPLEYFPTLGMTFEYHRRRYIYDTNHSIWTKIRCRTDIPLLFFTKWTGFESKDQVLSATIRYGPNKFAVKQPTFVELYKAQLLSPFTVFQLFCVVLWMLDDYWQYSFFTLFMILLFEGTVVFQRLKSLQALTGMGNKSRLVWTYREGRWCQMDSIALLPGDLLSLTRIKPKYTTTTTTTTDDKKKKNNDNKSSTNNTNNNNKRTGKQSLQDEGGDIVPADLLLLRGSTVVNEASLTGESVPQMKEGLVDLVADDDEFLTMKTTHKSHVVYAGTKMLQCKGELQQQQEEEEKESSSTTTTSKSTLNIPPPPDDGCVCFVLRTGFSSAQGKLVRMIEGSQEKVKGHERETGLLLLLLFFFAVASSSYVLYHGLIESDGKRSQYELLLHCILIITSVIPPELPMQMALAVNNSLMTLMKLQIFCTEPFRVPMAGKLDSCLFDKTGTLTTDELVAVGVLEPNKLLLLNNQSNNNNNKSSNNNNNNNEMTTTTSLEQQLTPMTKVTGEAALVLAGCHSLVSIDGETTGDPLESAALSSMRWQVSSSRGGQHVVVVPSPATEKKVAGNGIQLLKQHQQTTTTSGQVMITEVAVHTRHHFSSKLQRMSCVITTGGNGSSSNKQAQYFAVAKGSPEAIGKLLLNKPNGYDLKSKQLAKEGYRVISLAYKTLSNNNNNISAAKDGRAACEEGLIFAGFIAFTCRVRKDTANVLSRLKEGGMSIAMVTGDAILTAIHVAKEVGICDEVGGTGTGTTNKSSDDEDPLLTEKNPELVALLESKQRGDGTGVVTNDKKNKKNKNALKQFKPILILEQDSQTGNMYWQRYDDDDDDDGTKSTEPFVALQVPTLAKTYDLATTGKSLAAAFEYDQDTKTVLGSFKVFARMAPDAKETVIECLHGVGALCLMCGDGANDVGALKQADVGVALLSGFGDINVDRGEDGNKKKKKKEDDATTSDDGVRAIMSQEHLNQIRSLPVRLIKMKIRSLGCDPDKYPQLVEKEDLVQLYQIKAREVAVKRHDKKNALAKSKQTKAEKQAEAKAKVAEKQRRMLERVAELEAQGESWATFKAMREFAAMEMEEAKQKKGVGRGVEGSAAAMAAQFEDLESNELPMVKLGDASIAAPFTSKMPSIRSCVDIVRQGRCTLVSSMQMYQILALNCLISSYSLSVLYLDGIKYGDTQMTAMGMLGSISFMSVSRSKPLDRLSSVRPLTSIFHPSMFISLLGQFAIHLTTMILATRSAKALLPEDHEVDLDGQFKPGLLNTVVFLVSNVQQVTVFVVNLQGRPFMTGLTENRPLLWSLLATFILTFMFASESVPGLNKYFQLVPFPDDAYRDYILKLLAIDVIGSFLLDRILKFIFAPQILMASVKGTTMKDVFGLARTVGVMFFLMYSFLGNDDTWEEMMRQEGRLEELGLNGTDDDMNITNATAANLTNVVNETVATVVEAVTSSSSSGGSDGAMDEF